MRLPNGRGHKYSAVATVIDGIRFASKAEARRYQELRLLERAGEIKELEIQPKFPLHVHINGRALHVGDKPICTYIADFRYRQLEIDEGGFSGRWRSIVEDVKGMKTAMYRLKKKMVEIQYGIRITEITTSRRSVKRAH